MKTVAKAKTGTKTKCNFGNGAKIKSCKERGEWAELCFMARAAGEGLRVSKPYGDSSRYDVGVEHRGPIWRVQVKSTIYRRRNGEYSLNVMGPKRKKYARGTVDFFAIYLIPVDAWYIIPYAVVGRKNLSLHFTPHSPRHKYAKYREAWELLREGKGLTMQACVEEVVVDSFPCAGFVAVEANSRFLTAR
jgi:PD-(D/E)XK endonuclease